jgi:two-component sensor histidine kinase
MQSVDHTKLHNQIVQKAFDATSAFLTKEQTQQLFQNKIDRARAMLEAQERLSESWHTDC